VEARALERRLWGRISTLLQSFKNAFKQKFRPKYAEKMRILGEKCKSLLSVESSAPEPQFASSG